MYLVALNASGAAVRASVERAAAAAPVGDGARNVSAETEGETGGEDKNECLSAQPQPHFYLCLCLSLSQSLPLSCSPHASAPAPCHTDASGARAAAAAAEKQAGKNSVVTRAGSIGPLHGPRKREREGEKKGEGGAKDKAMRLMESAVRAGMKEKGRDSPNAKRSMIRPFSRNSHSLSVHTDGSAAAAWAP